MLKVAERAVVLGASMSGLMAARVLADHYDSVTVVERDALSDDATSRRGVPQGRHGHALLARGSQILDELFPGFLADLVADGAPVWSDGDFSRLYSSFGGHKVVQAGTSRRPQPTYYPSRPFLERSVRQRVRSLPNVTILDSHDVIAPIANAKGDRITGVRVVNRDSGSDKVLTADLVVDATGRGSRMPVFLEALGYERPREDELTVRLAYASQTLRIPAGTLREGAFLKLPEPGRPTAFALFGNENDNWVLTVGSMMGQEPPSVRDDILDFLEDFAPAQALAAVRAAEPVGEVSKYRVPSSRWRRYDKLRRLPMGLLVIGDAICSFNPIYGQGMTVAAVEAMVLRDCLRRGGHHLPQRFFRAAAKKIDIAWHAAVGSDLALPEVKGPRPFSMRLTNSYVDRLLTAAETDPVVAEQFFRVTGMIDPPARLLRPSILFRTTRATWRKRPPAAAQFSAKTIWPAPSADGPLFW
jgi:2-polyprenyl-6-methoxyphenol hydroxylase-like FAD-dependent oxidoreductase